MENIGHFWYKDKIGKWLDKIGFIVHGWVLLYWSSGSVLWWVFLIGFLFGPFEQSYCLLWSRITWWILWSLFLLRTCLSFVTGKPCRLWYPRSKSVEVFGSLYSKWTSGNNCHWNSSESWTMKYLCCLLWRFLFWAKCMPRSSTFHLIYPIAI